MSIAAWARNTHHSMLVVQHSSSSHDHFKWAITSDICAIRLASTDFTCWFIIVDSRHLEDTLQSLWSRVWGLPTWQSAACFSPHNTTKGHDSSRDQGHVVGAACASVEGMTRQCMLTLLYRCRFLPSRSLLMLCTSLSPPVAMTQIWLCQSHLIAAHCVKDCLLFPVLVHSSILLCLPIATYIGA